MNATANNTKALVEVIKFGVLAFGFVSSVFAQSSVEIDRVNSLARIAELAQEIADVGKKACFRSLLDTKFCSCLMQNLPIGILNPEFQQTVLNQPAPENMWMAYIQISQSPFYELTGKDPKYDGMFKGFMRARALCFKAN